MKRIGSALLLITVLELALGGGGRLLAVGPVSLRMVLFGLTLCFSAWWLMNGQRLQKRYLILLIMFAIMIITALLIGVLTGAEKKFWWEDVKPLLYFFSLPFFAFTLRNDENVKNVNSIWKISALVMAVGSLLILLLIHSGMLPFLSFYRTVIGSEEFFFRGEYTFFYKGFLLLGIGLLLYSIADDRYKLVIISVLFLALLLSFTRGFLLAFFATLFLYLITKKKIAMAVVLFSLGFSTLAFGEKAISTLSQLLDNKTKGIPRKTLLGDRLYSDDQRKLQITEVLSAVTFQSALVGHGFGHGVPSKPVHMEIAYLEIFHKQGLVGLLFWSFLLWKLWQSYRLAPPSILRDSFFFSALFVYIQSLTNQYVNNPIGLSVVLLSLVSLDQLSHRHE